jgi:hypothetical protein
MTQGTISIDAARAAANSQEMPTPKPPRKPRQKRTADKPKGIDARYAPLLALLIEKTNAKALDWKPTSKAGRTLGADIGGNRQARIYLNAERTEFTAEIWAIPGIMVGSEPGSDGNAKRIINIGTIDAADTEYLNLYDSASNPEPLDEILESLRAIGGAK